MFASNQQHHDLYGATSIKVIFNETNVDKRFIKSGKGFTQQLSEKILLCVRVLIFRPNQFLLRRGKCNYQLGK